MIMKSDRILFFSILLLILAVIVVRYSETLSNKANYSQKFENVLEQKCEKINKFIGQLEKADEKKMLGIINRADNEGLVIFKYMNDSLVLWSSNSVPIYDFYPDSIFVKPVVRFFNSFYYVVKKEVDSFRYVGLVKIKSRYPYKNDFLHSGFDKDFSLPDDSKMNFGKGAGYEIKDKNGQYLFNLVIPDKPDQQNTRKVIATIMLFFSLISFGLSIFLYVYNIADQRKRLKVALIFITGILLARIAQAYLSIGFRGFLLFDPYIYADSFLVPGLGDLLINSIVVLLVSLLITYFIRVPVNISWSKRKINFALVSLNILALAFFLYAHYFFYSLIFNSNISFELSEIDQLSVYTFISFLVCGINFLAAGIVLVWYINFATSHFNLFKIVQVLIPTAGIVFATLYIFGYSVGIVSMLFYFLFYFLFIFIKVRKYNLLSYSTLEIFVLLFAIFSLAFIVTQSAKKEKTIRSSLAVSLANEHDPIAEYLFEDLSRQVKGDTSIINRLNKHSIDINNLYIYLKNNYFTGYWNKYDMQITLCGPKDSVLIETPDYQWFYCYGFFNAIINEVGLNLPGSSFYYLDNYTGRISYIGRFPFNITDYPHEISLFIELDSKLTSDLVGYPELLLDEKLHQQRLIDQYSYAKYHKGNLVSQYGSFGYSLSPEIFGNSALNFETINLDGYKHLLYRSEEGNLIVLSKPTIKFIDLIIAFSYLFLFYYLCLILAFAVIKLCKNKRIIFLNNFRARIQTAIVSILVISMILIAGSTIWLNLRSYRQSQDKILNEKMQSVLIELSHKLSFQDKLTPYWSAGGYDNLNQLLIKFSDVFYTDINLYTPSGDLLATSRIDIFQTGLQGEKMDPIAWHKMAVEKRPQFIHREKIGELKYMSAYVHFENADGNLLAYLNLPFFTKQRELQTALYALILTIINIYVILILITISITILISDQITRPLEMLQLRFRDLKLGGRYEQIKYKRKDEIGNLVAEYNKMVIELEKSVDLLARSERESAWREMARQVAHEIKNPLTPMRLSVQQLQRSRKDNHKDYDKYLKRVTNTLIEQIDTLSSIASEFSNFAKMPVAIIEKVDLIKVINKSVELFADTSNCKFAFNTKLLKAEIEADKEQLSRVFLNLIKNGIQSVPEGKRGEISIGLARKEDKIEFRISDNGKGIEDDVRSKLFKPNFTTKSSGMGLGLAIVHNILDEIGAEITFETKIGKGTTFIILFEKA